MNITLQVCAKLVTERTSIKHFIEHFDRRSLFCLLDQAKSFDIIFKTHNTFCNRYNMLVLLLFMYINGINLDLIHVIFHLLSAVDCTLVVLVVTCIDVR